MVTQYVQSLEAMGLKFDAGKPVGGQASGKILRQAKPTKQFWDLWKRNKHKLKQNGISVTKSQATNEFVVCAWIPVDEKLEADMDALADVTFKALKKTAAKKLFDYQIPHTEKLLYAMENYGAALDGSDTGTGKSFAALALAKHMGLSPFIVCSKKAIRSWQKYCEHMDVYPLMIVNWEMLRTGKLPQYLAKTGTDKLPSYEWNVNARDTLVIFDEVHRAKTKGTLNSKMLLAARRQQLKVLALSATVAESPMNLSTLGYVLGLYDKPSDHIKWAMSYGVSKGTFGGFVYDGPLVHAKKLHKAIYGVGKGSRMRIEELGDRFLQNQIIPEAFTMDNASEIQKVYDTMQYELQQLKLAMKNDARGENGEEKEENILTIQLRARQRVELLKVPTIVELAQDHLDEGKSVAIFVNFHQTLEAIQKMLDTDCVVHGRQKAHESYASMERFQEDKSRVIVLNIKAGGESISLHDLHGNHPRASIISPTYSAIDLVQALGRIHRAGARTPALQRIVFAEDTIEETVCERVQAKVQNIRSLNDGDLAKEFQLV